MHNGLSTLDFPHSYIIRRLRNPPLRTITLLSFEQLVAVVDDLSALLHSLPLGVFYTRELVFLVNVLAV